MNFKILLVLTYLFYISMNVISQCHIDDWTALKALYESTNGDNWEDKEGWEQILGEIPSQDCDLGKMKGVTLDEDYNKRVEDLFLPGNNLTGSIPIQLCMLTELKEISFAFNMVEGDIPNCMGELKKLEFLGFAFNQLTGSIPKEFGDLSNLESLNLMSNQITGPIPSQLGNLESAWFIYLSDNKLTGAIPPELGNLSIGVHLFLSNNQLTGTIPPVFADFLFNDLRFTLFNNNLSGCFDGSLTKLCDSFNNGIYGFGDSISEGNDFDATWKEFCETGTGICDTTNRCHPTDWQALQTIYQNYGGTDWANTTGWDSLIVNQDSIPETCNLNELYGVSTNAEGSVDSIDLSGNQLKGSFRADWLNFTELSYLNIANNNLSGCFDTLAITLCEQLNSPYFVSDSLIDAGNNFDSRWAFFCAYQSCDTAGVGIFNFAVHQSLNLLPNPAIEFIFLEVDDQLLHTKPSFKIYNLQGYLIDSNILSNSRKINIQHLLRGTYFIRFADKQKLYAARFVKW